MTELYRHHGALQVTPSSLTFVPELPEAFRNEEVMKNIELLLHDTSQERGSLSGPVGPATLYAHHIDDMFESITENDPASEQANAKVALAEGYEEILLSVFLELRYPWGQTEPHVSLGTELHFVRTGTTWRNIFATPASLDEMRELLKANELDSASRWSSVWALPLTPRQLLYEVAANEVNAAPWKTNRTFPEHLIMTTSDKLQTERGRSTPDQMTTVTTLPTLWIEADPEVHGGSDGQSAPRSALHVCCIRYLPNTIPGTSPYEQREEMLITKPEREEQVKAQTITGLQCEPQTSLLNVITQMTGGPVQGNVTGEWTAQVAGQIMQPLDAYGRPSGPLCVWTAGGHPQNDDARNSSLVLGEQQYQAVLELLATQETWPAPSFVTLHGLTVIDLRPLTSVSFNDPVQAGAVGV